jgi:hypothetical protein
VLKEYNRTNAFIVPVRDAFESIASAKVYRDYVYANGLYGDNNIDHTALDIIVDRFREYIKYLLESPRFFIAPFHCFTKDHNETINKIVEFYKNELHLEVRAVYTKEEIFSKINLLDSIESYGENPFHSEIGSFPRTKSEDRERIEKILKSRYIEKIKEIQDDINILYQRYYDIEI